MSFLPWILACWLFGCGLYGIITSRNLIHTVICLSVLQASTYVVLISVGYKFHGTAPIFLGISSRDHLAVDPVVQALCLTDIVVEATVFAILLALSVQAYKRFGSLDPRKLHPFRG